MGLFDGFSGGGSIFGGGSILKRDGGGFDGDIFGRTIFPPTPSLSPTTGLTSISSLSPTTISQAVK